MSGHTGTYRATSDGFTTGVLAVTGNGYAGHAPAILLARPAIDSFDGAARATVRLTGDRLVVYVGSYTLACRPSRPPLAAGQGAVEEGEQAVPVALQSGGAEGVGVGHGEAVDGAGVYLAGVVDACGIQGVVELAGGLGRHVAFGEAEVDLGGDLGEKAVRAVGRAGDQEEGMEPGDGGHLAGMGRRGAHRQDGA